MGGFAKFLSLLSVIGFSFSANSQSILYVDADAVGGFQNGSSWQNAFVQLQDAFNSAVAGDQIWVAEGVYSPTRDSNDVAVPSDPKTKVFMLNEDNVKIYGGFTGNETTLSQRNWRKNKTILSGKIAPMVHTYMVFYSKHQSRNNRLDGFFIEDGELTGTTATMKRAAGITLRESEMELVNLIIQYNYADGGRISALWINGKANTQQINRLSNIEINNNQGVLSGSKTVHVAHTTVKASNLLITNNLNYTYAVNFYMADGSISFMTMADNQAFYQPNVLNGLINDHSPITFTGCINTGKTKSLSSFGASHLPTFMNCNLFDSKEANGNWKVVTGKDGGGNRDISSGFRFDSLDYRLSMCSPLIDHVSNSNMPHDLLDINYNGDTTELLPMDLLGKPRLNGTKADIGAYEYEYSLLPDTGYYYLCDVQMVIIKGETFTTPGIYYRKYTSRESCDSNAYINISTYIDDTALFRIGDSTLYSKSSGSQFQWFDCEYDSIISTSKDSIFTGPPGSYALILTRSGCTDTTNCYNLRGYIGSSELEVDQWHIYPNPVNQKLHIFTKEHTGSVFIKLINSQGKIIKSGNYINIKTLEFESLAPGIYLLVIETEKGTFQKKIFKY